MKPELTIVFPIIRTDFIDKAIETLYKFTDNSKFRVIVVDQSLEGWSSPWSQKVIDHGGKIIAQKNQGFAVGANTGLIQGLRWRTPYLAVANDDLCFIYPTWLEDLLEEFKTDEKIIAVAPESPRVAMWGYGMTGGEYVDIVPYKSEYTMQDIAYLKSGDYNEAEIKGRHPFQIPASFPFTKRGVIDGIAMWLPVFKREGLLEIGLFDERFVWGGGEDYDMNARAYSCAWPIDRDTCEEKYHKRMISTMKSWVWHHWGQSKDKLSELDPKLSEGRREWNKLGELWKPNFDTWGHWNDNGVRKPLKRDPQVFIHTP